jgi:hypothetical protein
VRMVSETKMQNAFGCAMNASDSASFCFARTCAGTGAGDGALAFRFCHQRQTKNAIAIMVRAASPHQSHSQPVEISTGGLMSRMPLTLVIFNGVAADVSRLGLF